MKLLNETIGTNRIIKPNKNKILHKIEAACFGEHKHKVQEGRIRYRCLTNLKKKELLKEEGCFMDVSVIN